MRTKNRTTWAAVAAAGVAAAIMLAGCTSEEEPGPTLEELQASASASAESSPTEVAGEAAAEYTAEEQAAIDAAKAAVTRFYEVSDAAYSAPKSAGSDAFDSVAIDPVKTEELGALGYFVAEDERLTGRTVVEFGEVQSVKTASDPEEFVYPEVFLEVCVDVSGTDVLDSSGKSVQGSGHERQSAVIGAYEEPGEGWFVSSRKYTEGGGACKP